MRIGRAGAEGEIVAVDAALGRAGNFSFEKLLAQAVRAAGGEFYAGEKMPGERMRFGGGVKRLTEAGEQGGIAEADSRHDRWRNRRVGGRCAR